MQKSVDSSDLHPARGAGVTTDEHVEPGTPPSNPLARRLSREEINDLDAVVYEGPIHLVASHRHMLKSVRALKRERLLGFDTETRPSFKKGESHPPALLQLAGRAGVYVFRLLELGLPAELAALLANPKIVKAGVAVGRDIRELRDLVEFEPAGFVDLGTRAKAYGMQHHGLRGLCALLLGRRLSKGGRLTNWARSDLPQSAITYAATDAWIGRRIYEAMDACGPPPRQGDALALRPRRGREVAPTG